MHRNLRHVRRHVYTFRLEPGQSQITMIRTVYRLRGGIARRVEARHHLITRATYSRLVRFANATNARRFIVESDRPSWEMWITR